MSSTNMNESIDKSATKLDITSLYSDLQTMIENVPKSPRLEQSPIFDNLPLTPTSSSPLLKPAQPPKINIAPIKKERDCPCLHILVSKDSEYCALCDKKIPILCELQKEREREQKKLKEMAEELNKKVRESKKYEEQINMTERRYHETNEMLKRTNEQYNSLKEGMTIIEKKLEQEKTEAQKAKQAKIDVENELEELSQRLFEEANVMVANEKKEKRELEVQYDELKKELKVCHSHLETEGLELKELKLKLGMIMEEQSSSSSSYSSSMEEKNQTEKNNINLRATRDLSLLVNREKNNDLFSENDMDITLLNEFKEFVESGEAINIRKIHSSSVYMKNTLVEDIEPCLRFGPNSRLSAKKLYEAIWMNTCFIEETPYGFVEEQIKKLSDAPIKISANNKNMIWERLSTSNVIGCQACGRDIKDLPFRFRISLVDDWGCIDKYCRDRLVSVYEFYTFIRNIRQGYYSGRTITDLYQESLRLKLQMFYARIGMLSTTYNELGFKESMIGHASEPSMIIPSDNPMESNRILKNDKRV